MKIKDKFLSEDLANMFTKMFGNRGTDAFELEWGFAKFIDKSLTTREAKWIEQIYTILLEKGHTSQNKVYHYNNDCKAWIHDIGVKGCKSFAVTNQNRNYICTVEVNEEVKHYQQLKDAIERQDQSYAKLKPDIIKSLIGHYEQYSTPKVHLRRFYDTKSKSYGDSNRVTDERKGNQYPQKLLLKSMKKGSYYGSYEYMDLRDTGYVWSTGEITPKLYDFGEVKYCCFQLNSLLTCLAEDYSIKVDFNFIKGTKDAKL